MVIYQRVDISNVMVPSGWDEWRPH